MLLPRTRYEAIKPDSGNIIRLRKEDFQADMQVETYMGGSVHNKSIFEIVPR
jgi:hypothetical protein